MSSAIYLGIDLGDHGALAWLGPERLHLDDMPVVKVAGLKKDMRENSTK